MTRGCSADSGTTTADTEIVRISHCGAFYFDNKYVHLESISTERELLYRYWGNVRQSVRHPVSIVILANLGIIY